MKIISIITGTSLFLMWIALGYFIYNENSDRTEFDNNIKKIDSIYYNYQKEKISEMTAKLDSIDVLLHRYDSIEIKILTSVK